MAVCDNGVGMEARQGPGGVPPLSSRLSRLLRTVEKTHPLPGMAEQRGGPPGFLIPEQSAVELDSERQPGGQTACGEAAFYCTQHRWGASGRIEY